jgi:methionine--tRNA ligase beta chain
MDKIPFEKFLELDIRVAEIVEAREHPDADKLFVLKIKIDSEEKQLVAGIRGTYDVDDLAGRKIIVINNLEPAVIRGQESEGMLLAASGENGPILITPEKDVPSGARVK